MTGIVITTYVALGALTAAGFWVMISKNMDSNDPKVRGAMGGVERAVESMPGGMTTVLVTITAVWPLFVVTGLNALTKAKRG